MLKIFRVGLVLALPVILAIASTDLRAEHDAATPAQEALEENIRDYLLSHPSIIIEVLDILRAERDVSAAQRVSETLAEQQEAIFYDPSSPVGGNPHGDVTIVEFFDYFCGYCKRVMPDLIQAMDDDPGIRFVYKEYPILGPDSVVASRIALAAHRQAPEKYADLHGAMMSSRPRMNEANALSLAGEFGYDVERLRADMNSPEIERILAHNNALAEQLGINGTPGFVIGDQVIHGAIDMETLLDLIAEARQS
jgi:protein-disulfide isomerase